MDPPTTSVVSSPRPRKVPADDWSFASLLGTEMVDLYVEPENHHFRVHKDLLCAKVHYFSKMFTGNFIEAKEKFGTFPEDDVDSFKALLSWVYQGKLPPMNYVKVGRNIIKPWNEFSFYCLADKLNLTELMDQAMDMFLGGIFVKFWPNPEPMAEAYSTAPPMWQKLLCHIFAFCLVRIDLAKCPPAIWNVDNFAEILESHGDLLRDVLALLNKKTGMITNPAHSGCEYHVHEKSDTCPLIK
jgi:hypothetical protein